MAIDFQKGVVPPRKLIDYLLATRHPEAIVLAFAVMAFAPLPGFGLVGCPLIGFGLGSLVIWITSEPESPLTPPNDREEQG